MKHTFKVKMANKIDNLKANNVYIAREYGVGLTGKTAVHFDEHCRSKEFTVCYPGD